MKKHFYDTTKEKICNLVGKIRSYIPITNIIIFLLLLVSAVFGHEFFNRNFGSTEFYDGMLVEVLGVIIEIILIYLIINYIQRSYDAKRWASSRMRLAIDFLSIHVKEYNSECLKSRRFKRNDLERLLETYSRCIDGEIDECFGQYIEAENRMLGFIQELDKDREIIEISSVDEEIFTRINLIDQFAERVFAACGQSKKIMRERNRYVSAEDMHSYDLREIVRKHLGLPPLIDVGVHGTR